MNSYEVLFEHALNPGGTYIIEDVETSFWQPGTKLYGSGIQSGGFNAEDTTLSRFRRAVNVVNKKFYDNTYSVQGDVDHWIKTITFAMNLVILQKKDKADCVTEDFYVWPGNLADDCPARSQGTQ